MRRDRLLTALRAARRCIRATRRAVFDGHCAYDHKTGKRVVTDTGALDWIAELDTVIGKIDDAMRAHTGKTSA